MHPITSITTSPVKMGEKIMRSVLEVLFDVKECGVEYNVKKGAGVCVCLCAVCVCVCVCVCGVLNLVLHTLHAHTFSHLCVYVLCVCV